jgi:pimeloyl-ACP methyl ester carboxylesterase
MRSSYTGFGFSSLAADAEDLSCLVAYLKTLGKEKIVLLGSSTGSFHYTNSLYMMHAYWISDHETGCQAILTYSKHSFYPSVDAYILQAPTSDRETASILMPPDFLAQTLAHAEGMIAKGEKDEIMPKALILPIFTLPVSAYRWHSLVAKGGDDDLFSSDIDDGKLVDIFAGLTKPALILMSEKDEMVPQTVDKVELLGRWIEAAPAGVVSELSGVNPEADHELSGEGAREWFVERVLGLLRGLEWRDVTIICEYAVSSAFLMRRLLHFVIE